MSIIIMESEVIRGCEVGRRYPVLAGEISAWEESKVRGQGRKRGNMREGSGGRGR